MILPRLGMETGCYYRMSSLVFCMSDLYWELQCISMPSRFAQQTYVCTADILPDWVYIFYLDDSELKKHLDPTTLAKIRRFYTWSSLKGPSKPAGRWVRYSPGVPSLVALPRIRSSTSGTPDAVTFQTAIFTGSDEYSGLPRVTTGHGSALPTPLFSKAINCSAPRQYSTSWVY
jgi:hypothetical protein